MYSFFNRLIKILTTISSFYKTLLLSSWKWLLLATILFFAGISFGYTAFITDPKTILAATEPAFATLEKLAQELEQTPFLKQVILIFQQNTISTTFILLTGILFGVIPVLVIWGNGTLVGILLAIAQQENELKLFASGIMYHALFEIPALILASAWGIKLGHKTFLTGIALFSRYKTSQQQKSLKETFNESGFIWLAVVFLLFLAACIEVGITAPIVTMY